MRTTTSADAPPPSLDEFAKQSAVSQRVADFVEAWEDMAAEKKQARYREPAPAAKAKGKAIKNKEAAPVAKTHGQRVRKERQKHDLTPLIQSKPAPPAGYKLRGESGKSNFVVEMSHAHKELFRKVRHLTDVDFLTDGSESGTKKITAGLTQLDHEFGADWILIWAHRTFAMLQLAKSNAAPHTTQRLVGDGFSKVAGVVAARCFSNPQLTEAQKDLARKVQEISEEDVKKLEKISPKSLKLQ
eukprot:g1931.t1